MNAPHKPDARAELTIRRVFNAPRHLVFRMWTDEAHLRKWCCPTGFTIPFSEGEIRTGGWFRTCMRAPDGAEHWLGGAYIEVAPDDRLAFTHAWEDGSGNSGHFTTVTVTFADAGEGKTSLTLHQAFFASGESRDGHHSGWSETLDNLEKYLAA